MYLSTRKLAIRLFTRVSWMSPARLARSLDTFSRVEADSGWQMLQAMAACDDAALAAKLFANALEEMHHAALFGRLARRLSGTPLPSGHLPRHDLFDRAKGIAHFEAFHYVGEVEVYDLFLAYAHAAPSGEVRNLFLMIRGDEEGHHCQAYQELVRLTGGHQQADRLIRRARWTRVFESWVRFSEVVGNLVSSAVFSVIYFTAGALLYWPCSRHLIRTNRPAIT